MSLINEALKKAQKLRREEAAGVAELAVPTNGATVIPKRGRAKSSHTMVLLASGAVVLVVLSVVLTVYLVNRTPTPPGQPAPVSTAKKPAKAPSTESPEDAPDHPLPIATSQGTSSVIVLSSPSDPASTPHSSADPSVPTIVLTPLPAVAVKPDERVVVFVEGLKVAGIRSSGNESRVLMNERVYRVNDIVDRVLGVKLVGVATNALTFTDANGATYLKQF